MKTISDSARRTAVSMILAAMFCAATPAVAQPTIVDLGYRPILAMNNHGLASVGTYSLAIESFYYKNGEVLFYPGTIYGLNDHGIGAGRCESGKAGVFVAAVCTEFEGVSGYTLGHNGLGINDAGTVVGYSYGSLGRNQFVARAFKYQNGVTTDLGALYEGWAYSAAAAINTRGLIVGYAAKYYQNNEYKAPTEAFLQDGDQMVGLGVPKGMVSSEAVAVNNQDQIVGNVTTKKGLKQPFLYQNGVYTLLGHPPGTTEGLATDINDDGTIVGYSWNGSLFYAQGWMYRVGSSRCWQACSRRNINGKN